MDVNQKVIQHSANTLNLNKSLKYSLIQFTRKFQYLSLKLRCTGSPRYPSLQYPSLKTTYIEELVTDIKLILIYVTFYQPSIYALILILIRDGYRGLPVFYFIWIERQIDKIFAKDFEDLLQKILILINKLAIQKVSCLSRRILKKTICFRYEKPTQTRRRVNYERSRAVYCEDMQNRVKFIMRKNRKDPYPGCQHSSKLSYSHRVSGQIK